MKVKAREREFNIFELFLHDGAGGSVAPFDERSLAAALNQWAEKVCPESFVWFVCPDDTFASSTWHVRFNTDRYEFDKDGQNKFQTYPAQRAYGEREFRRSLPPELDELLLELNCRVPVLEL